MSQQSLTISLVHPDQGREPLDLLLLEQEEWRPYTGRVSSVAMVNWLAAVLYGEEFTHRLDCGMSGEAMVCAVFAYPRVAGLAYQLRASHGELSERAAALVEITETVNFRLEATAAPRYPARQIQSARWLADCYDATGAVITPPTLTIDGDQLQAGLAIYGAAEVTYTTERHSYILTVARRDDAIEDHYSAVVYGVYDGGLNWLEIEPPPGVEAFEADPSAVCGLGSFAGSVEHPDPDLGDIPGQFAHRVVKIDYCSQDIISDNVYGH
jgi:hypothetical protein